MTKKLVIVESPSKSKTIGKYLGKDYIVTSSKGHVRDLATSGKDGLGVDIENHFQPKYVINKDKKDVVKELKAEVKKVDDVLLATDPDREGEAISWHLAEILGLDQTQKNRVVFHEVTKDAVLEAIAHPRTIDQNLVRSQETRRVLDRIIGFKLSKLLRSKIKSKSAGRVQSVALKLIVDREREIEKFKPEEYWEIKAKFEKDGIPFEAELTKIQGKKAKIKNEAEAKAIHEALDRQFCVASLKKTQRRRESKPPFITSTLQQEASTKLGFSAKKTMTLAQKLYEGVESWFARINRYGQSKGIQVVHYINSSGLKEMIEGTPIARYFRQIFASTFLYSVDGVAYWPGVAVNYTNKTQFIFKISKGIDSVYDSKAVNRFVPEQTRPVPFTHMIYIGDGTTDIPCMRLVKEKQGHSIAVYNPADKEVGHSLRQLVEEHRVNFVAPADYSPGSRMDEVVKAIIDKVAADDRLKKLEL